MSSSLEDSCIDWSKDITTIERSLEEIWSKMEQEKEIITINITPTTPIPNEIQSLGTYQFEALASYLGESTQNDTPLDDVITIPPSEYSNEQDALDIIDKHAAFYQNLKKEVNKVLIRISSNTQDVDRIRKRLQELKETLLNAPSLTEEQIATDTNEFETLLEILDDKNAVMKSDFKRYKELKREESKLNAKLKDIVKYLRNEHYMSRTMIYRRLSYNHNIPIVTAIPATNRRNLPEIEASEVPNTSRKKPSPSL